MTLGLVIVAAGFFISLLRFPEPARRNPFGTIGFAFTCVGWAIVLIVGLVAILNAHGAHIVL